MRCDEARERLAVRGGEDLPATEARRLDEHLARCAGCRAQGERVGEAVRALRATWEPATAPDPEEMREMLEGCEMASPGRRRWPRLAAAAVLAAAVAVLAWHLTRAPEVIVFASGPQVPPEFWIHVDPPYLIVPSSTAWENEETRLLIAVGPMGREARMSYEPMDGGPRVRGLDDRRELPQAESGPPALVLAASAAEPWQAVLGAAFPMGTEWSGLYLAGRVPGGLLGAVPMISRVPKILRDLGLNAVALDLNDREHSIPMFELRVTRDGEDVRYRWGRLPLWGEPAVAPWDGGDVTLSAAQVESGSVGALADLRSTLREGRSCIVQLETDLDARYVDVLRAVECADRDAAVRFFPEPLPSRFTSEIEVPEPPPGAIGIDEDRETGPRPRGIVNVTREGRLLVKRMVLDPAALDLSRWGWAVVLLRADRRAPWSSCLPAIREAKRLGCDLQAAFDDDPYLPFERKLDVPVPRGEPVTVRPVRGAAPAAAPDALPVPETEATFPPEKGPDGRPYFYGDTPIVSSLRDRRPWTGPDLELPPETGDLAGADVLVLPPEDATAGEVLRLVARLRAMGVTGFEFE